MRLEALLGDAARIMTKPGYEFAELAAVMRPCDPDWATGLLNALLADLLATSGDDEDRFFREVDLCGAGDFNLTLVEAGGQGRRPQLAASEFDMLVTNLAGTPLRVPVYRTDIDPLDVERRPGPLVEEQVVVGPYETACFRAYDQIADIGSSPTPGPALVVHSMPRGVLTWVFDRETLEPLNLTTTHLQVSRLQLALRVMSELGLPEDADRLAALARSEHLHFIRWEAAKAVYAVDPERGARLLDAELSDDPHPSIRRAARASLDNIAMVDG
ncbi:MAG TPA: HEAT repeat domain-containing protein [Thermoleophilaceae bacterium]